MNRMADITHGDDQVGDDYNVEVDMKDSFKSDMYSQDEWEVTNGFNENHSISKSNLEIHIKQDIKEEEVGDENALMLDNFENGTNEEMYYEYDPHYAPRVEDAGKWVNDKTVPPGWKIKRSGFKSCLMDPSGRIFPNRIITLQEMLMGEASDQDLELMKNLLRYDGWSTDEHLPEGWMYKLGSSNTYLYLTESCQVIETTSKAFEHLENESYSSDVINNFVRAVQNISKIKAMQSKLKKESYFQELIVKEEELEFNEPDIKDPSTTPSIRDPSITNSRDLSTPRLSSCVEVYLNQLRTGQGEVNNAVFNDLRNEGWEASEMLPHQWMSDGFAFISREGFYFETPTKVLGYFQQFRGNELAEADLEKVKSFLEYRCCWTVGATSNGKSPVTFSDGKRFPSKRMALQFMVTSNFPEDFIRNMRREMMLDGWQQVGGLPTGWMLRTLNDGPGWKRREFVDHSGNFFPSARKALNMMLKSGCFSREELSFMQSFSATGGNFGIKPPATVLPRAQPTLQERSVVAQQSRDAPPTMLAPWKSSKLNNGKTIVTFTNGRSFESRVRALKFMIENRFPAELVEMMRQELGEAGWATSPGLPAGWRIRTRRDSRGWRDQTFLDDLGNTYPSAKRAGTEMMRSGRYRSEEIQAMQNFFSAGFPTSVSGTNCESVLSYNESPVSQPGQSFPIITSPSLDMSMSRHTRFKKMIENNYPAEDIWKARSELVLDGWEDDPQLPPGWKTKMQIQEKNKGWKRRVFLSDRGDFFSYAKSALKFLLTAGTYSKHQVDYLTSLSMRSNMNWGISQVQSQQPEYHEDDVGSYKEVLKEEVDEFDQLLDKVCHKKGVPEDRIGIQTNNQQNVSFIEEYDEFDELDGSNDEPMAGRIGPHGVNLGFQPFIHQSAPPYIEENEDFDQIFNRTGESLNDLPFDDSWNPDNKNVDQHLNKTLAVNTQYGDDEQGIPGNGQNGDYIQQLPQPGSLGPDGLRITYGRNGKVYFICLNGKKLPSRRSALNYMVNNRFPEAYIEQIRPYLYLEGWEDNKLLPWKWKTKVVKSGSKFNKRIFMADSGERFETIAQANKYMKDAGIYSQQEIENVLSIDDDNSKIADQEIPIKLEIKDSDLPAGWRSYVDRTGKKRYLGPAGENVVSFAYAMKMMIEKGNSNEEIDEMRSNLRLDGWEDHVKLPKHWKTKLTKNVNNWSKRVFLTENGQHLGDLKTAIKYLEMSSIYNNDDVQNLLDIEKPLETKVEGEDPEQRKTEYKSIPCPKGWKPYYSKDGRTRFLSPDGKNFPSLATGYKYLIDAGFPKQAVAEMRFFLKYEKWEENPNLPNNWRVRFIKNGKFGRWKRKIFLTEQGQQFEIRNAISYMQATGRFLDEDIEKLHAVTHHSSSYYTTLLQNEQFLEDDSLPQGWRMKYGLRGKNYYVSPAGKGFASRRVALVHMVEENYNKADIEMMRMSLVKEGWMEHPHLPRGWGFKQVYGDQLSVVSDTGEHIIRITRAIEVLKSRYDFDVLENFKTFLENRNSNSNEKHIQEEIHKVDKSELCMTDWNTEDHKIPVNWMSKANPDGTMYFLSPDLIQFPVDANTMKFLETTGGSIRDQTDLASRLFNYGGWCDSKLLPTGWKYKRPSNNREIRILSEYGDLMNNFEEVKQYLSVNNFPEECFMDLDQFILDCEVCPFKDDYTVPTGWKLGFGRRGPILLSPAKQRFASRLAAFQYLVKSGALGPEIWAMRWCLQHEGWIRGDNIPEGWLQKTTESGESCFLSPEAEILSSLDNVQEKIRSNEYYSGNNYNTTAFNDYVKDEQIEDDKSFLNEYHPIEDEENEFISLEETIK